jgi:hypothetical protein
MSGMRHTLIATAVALATSAVAWIIGIDLGPALILGAIGGIIASVMLQRRGLGRARPTTGSEEPEDLDAAAQTAAASILDMQAHSTEIRDEDARTLATRLTDTLSAVLEQAHAGERLGVMPLILDQLIEPAQALITEYLWMQKRQDTASQDAMTRIATKDLPAAEHAARAVRAILEREGPLDINAVRRAVDFSFSFGGDAVSPSSEMWGNRERLVEEADRVADR